MPIMPSRLPSLRIGTASVVRTGLIMRVPYVYSGSAWTSGIWIVRRSSAARPAVVSRPGRIGFFSINSLSSGDAFKATIIRSRSPSKRQTNALSAPHSRTALSATLSNRLQLECRPADHFEHVGGGGLLLQGFAQLIEQPHVLNRNHCLIGESGKQLDVPVREGPHPVPVRRHHADRRS